MAYSISKTKLRGPSGMGGIAGYKKSGHMGGVSKGSHMGMKSVLKYGPPGPDYMQGKGYDYSYAKMGGKMMKSKDGYYVAPSTAKYANAVSDVKKMPGYQSKMYD